MSGPLAIAFAGGLLAPVNPCGFALLPGFLGLHLGGRDDADGQRGPLARAAEGFVVGLVLSASFAAVFAAAGLVVAAGLRSLLGVVPWLALAIGIALALLGFAMLAGRHVRLAPGGRLPVGRGSTGYRRVAAFGGTYALASLSCTLGVFLAVVGQAVAAASPLELAGVFVAYGAGSATILIALSLSAALARSALARALRRLVPLANRLAGALLALSGAYLILYWLPSLAGGSAGQGPVARLSAEVSGTLTGFFSAHAGSLALAALILIGLTLLVLAGRPRSRAAR